VVLVYRNPPFVIVLGIGVKFVTEPGREVVTEHEWALGY